LRIEDSILGVFGHNFEEFVFDFVLPFGIEIVKGNSDRFEVGFCEVLVLG
jgi:hypothetical protein